MIRRELKKELLEASSEYPVVTLFGPRQAGKTTLVRTEFPKKPYWSLEDPDVRTRALADPRGFLAEAERGMVLDEIQRAPELLSYIQGIVDRSRQRGQFILTGSHQPELHTAISQTLAGRTALLTLLPLSFNELRQYKKKLNPFELIVNGAFPRLYEESLKPVRFFNSYLRTYVERDVRALINLKDLRRFQQFLTLLAGRVGQVVNYTSLGNDVGVSATSIKNWVSVLTASYVIVELPPYFENIGKRVIRSPKVYFTDTGLVAALLGISTPEHVERDPLRGVLYENLIVMEILKRRLNAGMQNGLFFYRDTHGNEVDLIIRSGRSLVPVEIKSAATFSSDFVKGVERFREAVGSRGLRGFVAYNGKDAITFKGTKVFNPLVHDSVLRNVAMT
jgi:predicted AAA+ superfamily ATPase